MTCSSICRTRRCSRARAPGRVRGRRPTGPQRNQLRRLFLYKLTMNGIISREEMPNQEKRANRAIVVGEIAAAETAVEEIAAGVIAAAENAVEETVGPENLAPENAGREIVGPENAAQEKAGRQVVGKASDRRPEEHRPR